MGASSEFVDIEWFGVVPIHPIPDAPQANQFASALVVAQPRQLGPSRLFSSP